MFRCLYKLGGKMASDKAKTGMRPQAVDVLADRAFDKLDTNQEGDSKDVLDFQEFMHIADIHPFVKECILLHIPTMANEDDDESTA